MIVFRFMKDARIRYFTLIICTIMLGLLSRHIKVIPLWIGDVLWATMVYFMVGFLFPKPAGNKVIMISLAFCYMIEITQLYHAEWIDSIRLTLPGKLILGSVFSWGDILSYTAGILLGVLITRMAIKHSDRPE